MMASVIPNPGELLAAALIAVVVLGAAAIVAAVWLRRRWGKLRGLVAGHVRGLVIDAGTAGWRWLWSRPLPDRRWRSIHRTRRQTSRALASAGHAVGVARSAGVPLGDLESLCRRLRQVASDVDSSLRIAQRATGPLIDAEAIARQADDVVASAGRIQYAAAMALTGTSGAATIELADDVHREVAAMASGIATAGRCCAPVGSSQSVGASGATVASVWPNN